jgi:hypothetical protein
VIDGTLHVDIQAVVEPDGNLVQTGQLESPDGHDIPLDGVFVFEDLDPSSDEVIDYLVISDSAPRLRGGGRHQRWQGQLDGAPRRPRQLRLALAGWLHRTVHL